MLTIPDKSFMRSIGPSLAAILLRSTIRLLQNGELGERPDLSSTLLDCSGTQKAERLITLPRAWEVALPVVSPAGRELDRTVRQGVSVSRTMDIYERAERAGAGRDANVE